MSFHGSNSAQRRANPFARNGSASPAPSPRPHSALLSSPAASDERAVSASHSRSQSSSSLATGAVALRQLRSNSKTMASASGTFAPSFIKTDEMGRGSQHGAVEGIEGENDFSGKRYVWLKDAQHAFIKGWVVEELADNAMLVQTEDGTQRRVEADKVDKVNPAKFDKANDMAELTHLNEASVVHNLEMRYQADLIYTYSGLFLVTVNPYCALPIYNNEYINMYRGRSREDGKPHIFAMADEAFRNLVDEGRNQSILVTGESGAGKTENTKKVIQYLAAVAQVDVSRRAKSQHSTLSQQILRANPILEAFGNAQTVRNNNSSRFGKFIRIEFNRSGAIAGAFIDWYLLEKSRVVGINAHERNYHIFYQLLKGADSRTKAELLLEGLGVQDFAYTRKGHDSIAGVSDREEWGSLMEAFEVMEFSGADQRAILETVAAVLHLGNLGMVKESRSADQARLAPQGKEVAAKVCKLLGVALEPFVKSLLRPKVKAGREWVEKEQTPEQVRLSLDALAKGIYERGFGDLVSRINGQLDRSGMGLGESHFIGVLDIAGFEIFEQNSFEQLCINYTNEKLQQFFNHHMFVLEQEEYARERIEWQFIDFGRDLQPTIDLIELSNPIGIFSCLDEDCVMPKATDKSFSEKLNALWDKKSSKYRPRRLGQGFVLTHYAAEVEYSTEGWLAKNKDPINDNITRLLSRSSKAHVAALFGDCAEGDDEAGGGRRCVKKGLFRTVAQRHKEQLHSLMTQLHSTHAHFVRCILPNHKKRPKQFNGLLVLDQLRCNGVLEGIRIARTGFPNRLPFGEFRQRYEVLCSNMPRGQVQGQSAASLMLDKLGLDKSLYRVGLSKVFFRAGVLAELEEKRDGLISHVMARFQSLARGFMQRRSAYKRLFRSEATRIIQRNFDVYLGLVQNPWWQLIVKMKPLLGATCSATEVKRREQMIKQLSDKMQAEVERRQKLEEERRNCQADMMRIQQTLESERALALDKEEIFKRLQTREAELEEKLAGALEDQERVEEQLDELMEAKNRAEGEVEKFGSQLEQAAGLIAKLEEDKRQLSEGIGKLQEQVAEMEHKQGERSEQEAALQDQIQVVQSQLAVKEKRLLEVESKLVKVDQDSEVKLLAAQKEAESGQAREAGLREEKQRMQQQLWQLSKTSSDYEDLMRSKESELALLRSDKKQFEREREGLEEQKKRAVQDKQKMAERLREVQAELVATQAKQGQLEREAQEAKKLLQARLSEDGQADENRELLESQVKDLKEELFEVQKDLSRERQSRDDVLLLGEHKYESLKEEYERLNESKIIIEKELYGQQDTLRRCVEARAVVEGERDEARDEMRRLRVAKRQAEEGRLQAEAAGEQQARRSGRERQERADKELEAAQERTRGLEEECARLKEQVAQGNKAMAWSGESRAEKDQAKQRLERELGTVKSRLAASEHDNKALLNKLQQKGLEIARSASRASEAWRTQRLALERDKRRVDEANEQLHKQLDEAQERLAWQDKRAERLQLSLEDAKHEVAREAQTSRKAEKAWSSSTAELAEAKRTIAAERSQGQATRGTLQASLQAREAELAEGRALMLSLVKTVSPEVDTALPDDKSQRALLSNFDLVRRVEELQQALRVQRAARATAEEQLRASRGHLLSSEVARDGEVVRRGEVVAPNDEVAPNEVAHNEAAPDSEVAPNEVALLSRPRAAAAAHAPSPNCHDKHHSGQLQELQSQLQLSHMQNRQLQAQLERATPDADDNNNNNNNDGASLRRLETLKRANSRLHDMLDDSAKTVSALQKTLHSGELSLRDVETRSHLEILDTLNSQEQSRRALLNSHHEAVAELASLKTSLDKTRRERAKAEVELRDAKSDLHDMTVAHQQEAQRRSQLLDEYTELQMRLDAEASRLADVTATLHVYKARADDYFGRLEQAEIAVLKATRAEHFAKSQAQEADDACAHIMAERHKLDAALDDLQRHKQRLDERVEDLSTDLDAATQAKKRLQHELDDYRNQRAMDIEDKESSMEQTRNKYQAEFAALAAQLDLARTDKLHKQAELGRLREELDDLRSKWDHEVLNSSTWCKEKARLESTLADMAHSRQEALDAHSDAQAKVVALLSQLRSLRSSLDHVSSERDLLHRHNRGLEARLSEAKAGLDHLAQADSPSLRDAATMDKELLQLKSTLAHHQDVAAAALERMRRAEALASEMQKDIAAERDAGTQLHKQKALLEKSLNEAQLKLVDLETKGYSSATHDIKFLHKRIHELETQLESKESEHAKSQRSTRNVDRVVKDLQGQIERKEKQNGQLSEDVGRMRDKVDKLLKTIDELQASESTTQLSARRAERELREEKEKSQRLERELRGWKDLKTPAPPASSATSPAVASLRARGSFHADSAPALHVPRRKSSIARAPSLTKGFL
ncbi:hypothetical protein CDD81_3115 [Ophiocordyceps australis]|uniref:Uncharacterized protein n=1 Tax=Ophiocordyceps australis TaxID=1399860 RepID=A0A2C5YC13_9HYPO|nr:hypothetical protein CDD81_3115 [Ophiocordyceps australis]